MRASLLSLGVVLMACPGAVTLDGGALPDAQAGLDAGPEPDAGSSAFAPHPTFMGLDAGQVLDLGLFTCEEFVGQTDPSCRSVTAYSGFAYDSTHHQLLMFGGGHSATIKTDVYVLDLAQGPLTWRSAYPSTPYGEMVIGNLDLDRAKWLSTGHPLQHHTYDGLVWVPTTGRLVDMKSSVGSILYSQHYPADFPPTTRSSDIFEYDPLEKRWSSYSTEARWPAYGASSWDPTSGHILYLSEAGLWSWDPVGHVVSKVLPRPNLPLSYGQNLVYVPDDGAHYYLRNDGLVYRLSYDTAQPSRTTLELVTTLGTPPPGSINPPDYTETGWAWDGRRHRVCGGLMGGVMHCFAPSTATWTAHPVATNGRPPQKVMFHMLQYDPVNDVFLFLSPFPNVQLTYPQHTFAWRPD